jgi:prepilin-type processing-associated H-X9-DG protein/prepilin-type N-terminal cleavage/methylation domain-containing protein
MMRKDRDKSSWASGFSLVELLVVIGIIVVLVAILLPSLVRARESAQQVKCAANLRTLGQLLTMHANDHRGYLPLAGNIAPGSDGSGLDNPQTLGDSCTQRYDYYDNGGGVSCVTAMPAALAPYLTSQTVRSDSWQDVDTDIQADGLIQNAFVCPADEETINRTYTPAPWVNNYGGGTFLNGWSSYGINAEVFAWTDEGVNGTTGHSRSRGKIALLPHPSETMLMCDSRALIEIWVLAPQLSLGDVYLGTGGTVSNSIFDFGRHQGNINILYADGHVDNQHILSNASDHPVGVLGSPRNSPSGALMDVSMDKDFQ